MKSNLFKYLKKLGKKYVQFITNIADLCVPVGNLQTTQLDKYSFMAAFSFFSVTVFKGYNVTNYPSAESFY